MFFIRDKCITKLVHETKIKLNDVSKIICHCQKIEEIVVLGIFIHL
jgi:hypothetical protein